MIGSDIMANKKKKKKIPRKAKIAILISINIVIILGVAGLLIYDYLLGGLNRNKNFTTDMSELGINSSRLEETQDLGVVNIALFGVDSRQNTFTGLSDAIMVCSIDLKNGKIKLTSVARDSQVVSNGRDIKINSAYSTGGCELAVKTLNQNFNLDIQDYVTINMNSLSKVIEVAGGVTLEITNAERIHANGIMDELTPNSPKIQNSGLVTLTGDQAVAFCRIRKIDSDLYRTDRQRKVLSALFEKAKELSVGEIAKAIHTISPMVETSLSNGKIVELSKILTVGGIHIENLRFPHDNTNYQSSAATGWNIAYDLDIAADELHQFIYNNVRPDSE